MKRLNKIPILLAIIFLACNQQTETSDRSKDAEAIMAIITKYDHGWDARDVKAVLAGYSDDIDWTNAFGDRVQGKQELEALLETIFSLDFVMSGENNYQEPEINFLSEDIALVRSVNIRTGQKWPDGSLMKDRVINHLRVFI